MRGDDARVGHGWPRVALVAHVAYYRHAAVALDEAGLLDRWVTSPVFARELPGERLPFVGAPIVRLNANRVFEAASGLPVRRMWLAQMVASAADVAYSGRPAGSAFPVKTTAWDIEASTRLGRPDVLHAMSGVGIRTGAVARRHGSFVVCDVRTAHPDLHRASVVRELARRGIAYRPPNESITGRMETEFRRADLIIGCSELVRRSFMEVGFDPERVVAVPYGVDVERFSPAAMSPDRFTVLFAGRERARKGFAVLGEAARALPATSLLLVTGEPDRESSRLLAGVRAKVEFVGEVSAADMVGLYRRASVLALPSLSEAFGLVVAEALACGVPVIVSSQTGAADLVTDGVNGFVVPTGDADLLADRLSELERDRDRLEVMRPTARRAAEAASWDVYGERLVGVYRDVVIPRLG